MPVLLTEVGHWRLHSGVLKNYRLVFKRVMSDKVVTMDTYPEGGIDLVTMTTYYSSL